MKIVTIVPINGREDILRQTMPRMVKQVDKVIVGGHTEQERDICVGADFLRFVADTKLGIKWQACLFKAREYKPDAVLIMGSGSMISDNWFDVLYPQLSEYAMTGVAGFYLLDYQPGKERMFFWPGYIGGRSIEPIGIGRLVSAEFLDICDWQLFDITKNRGLDHSVMQTINKFRGKVNVHRDQDIQCMRISSYKYTQYDSYDKLRKHSGSIDISDTGEVLKHFGL